MTRLSVLAIDGHLIVPNIPNTVQMVPEYLDHVNESVFKA